MDTIVKLRQMLNNRYGKGLELRPLMDLSKLEIKSDTIVHGNDLYIPIMVEQQFLGTAVIPHGWELAEDNRKSLAQLVRMVLEPMLYNSFLERREANLKCLESLDFPDTNLSLFGEDEEEIILATNDSPPLPKMTTSLIHLQGRLPAMSRKVALQIHEISGRWAFVPFEDVARDLKNALDISHLGAMTLFIEKIEDLSNEHQDLLTEYLKSPRSLSEPLIITSSEKSPEQLSQLMTSPELLQEMMTMLLEVERAPLNSQILREMVSLFFQPEEQQDLH